MGDWCPVSFDKEPIFVPTSIASRVLYSTFWCLKCYFYDDNTVPVTTYIFSQSSPVSLASIIHEKGRAEMGVHLAKMNRVYCPKWLLRIKWKEKQMVLHFKFRRSSVWQYQTKEWMTFQAGNSKAWISVIAKNQSDFETSTNVKFRSKLRRFLHE